MLSTGDSASLNAIAEQILKRTNQDLRRVIYLTAYSFANNVVKNFGGKRLRGKARN